MQQRERNENWETELKCFKLYYTTTLCTTCTNDVFLQEKVIS